MVLTWPPGFGVDICQNQGSLGSGVLSANESFI
jgi:hypothetical protein